jgi:hypothetical protein
MDEDAIAGSGPGAGYVTPRWIGIIVAYLILVASGMVFGLMLLWPSCDVPGDETGLSSELIVTAVGPSSGSVEGGEVVTIKGVGFVEKASASFGGEAAGSVDVDGPTSLKARTPAHKAGRVDVVVTNPDGTNQTLAGSYIYFDPKAPLPKPSISSLAPSSGPLLGGQKVTVKGAGFSGVTTVAFGGLRGTNVKVLDDTILSVSTPAHADGRVDVTVGDGSTATLSNGYAYTCWWALPYRLFLMVISAGALGGTLHSLRSLFWYVGNRDLRWSWLPMYCLLPVSGAGTAAIFFLLAFAGLYTVQGTPSFILIGLGALVGMFSAQAAEKLKTIAEGLLTSAPKGANTVTPQQPAQKVSLPTIASVAPQTGPSAGAQVVTITGTGLSGVAAVKFGGVLATNLKVANATSVSVTTPAHAPGTVDVVVGDPPVFATVAAGYTYT